MLPHARRALTPLIGLLLSSPSLAEDTSALPHEQCAPATQDSETVNDQPITIKANTAKAISESYAQYEGDVTVRQGARYMQADSATLRQPENIVTAEGDVIFSDGQVEVKSDKLVTNLTTEDSEMHNAKYRLLCQQGRGEAYRVYKDGQKIFRLQDGSFTTCPEGDKSWNFSASHIERDDDSPYADFYNARFEVLDVPILYAPWLRVPVGEQRLTGFLFPTIGIGSRDGLEFELPFYWNIAPNYDLTLTPKYMEKRGLQMGAEFRYLWDIGEGSLSGEILDSDKKNPSLGKRWAFNWQHYGTYKQHWLIEADYSRVSDTNYFVDLDSDIGQREDNQLMQTGAVSYRDQHWNSRIMVRDFQQLTGDSLPYRLVPQLDFNFYYPNSLLGLDWNMNSSVSRFETDDPNKPSADRVHLEPSISLPLSDTWWYMNTEAKLMYTYYNQKNIDNLTLDAGETNRLESSVTRTLPSFRWDGGVYLERDTEISGHAYTQSLEPRIQYLYIPKEDQSAIYQPFNYAGGGYDTTLLQTDYYGLFRDRKYSGIDYIAEANQVSVGATTRYFDSDYIERFNLSFGQIFYLNDTGNTSPTGQDAPPTYSAWALESDFNYADWLFFHSSLQYDANINQVQLANTTMEYRQDSTFAQLSYRYITKDYISQTVNLSVPGSEQIISDEGISQLGFETGFSITNNWKFRANYYHDLNEDIMLQSYAGLTYEAACWAMGISYNEYLRDYSFDAQQADYENNISFTVSLRGLSTQNLNLDTTDGGNSLGYGRPFYLNN
ncbi:LPS-assembly protein LptD [Vibrio stylophorae]|uniref:LPS-assembly protein LptD n=1 Tax=Vibrio stylophorae TaxID=659351 RepID=A0ABN8DQ35_9VIBR|nr:LPS assembly protein LptD [Vibrio stylophorae]CAH0532568.1 LPS-assembly protein LptD [Vibrio stylophorae]